MRIRICALAACITLAGCVSAGTKVDPNVVATFQPGVTTLVDAERQLGQPNSTTSLPDGSTIIAYSYTHAQASASSYIPVAGAFVGHSDSNSVIEVLTFDAAGKYVRASNTTSQASAGLINHQ
jgi:hypothetical protein